MSKLLNSVAHDVAHSFGSRNNDLGGYWALGILYSYALKNNLAPITLNLLDAHSDVSMLSILSKRYSSMCQRLIQTKEVNYQNITKAELTIDFCSDIYRQSILVNRFTENLFKIQVTIKSNNNVYSRGYSGYCFPNIEMSKGI